MKNKSFDCVEMKRQGAEAIYKKISSLSTEQQLEYWRQGSDSLRKIKELGIREEGDKETRNAKEGNIHGCTGFTG